MAWIALNIQADNHLTEALSDFLLSLGALSVSILDADASQADESPIFGEPNMPPPGFWKKNVVNALLSENMDSQLVIAAVQAEFQLETIHYSLERVAEQDWVRLTQSQFEPIQILDRLWIVPSWHEVPDPQAINIRLDPGLAFGTGSHPTTFLCLQWLSQEIRSQHSVIDYGCGSGILAIAAKKLGARQVFATDIDPHAMEASLYNAEQNHVTIELCDAQAFQHHIAADIVVANILSSALIVLAPALAKLCAVGGKIALSGILQAQIPLIQSAYAPWFDLTAVDSLEGWVLMAGVRRAEPTPTNLASDA